MDWTLLGFGLLTLTLGALAYRRIWLNWIFPVPPGHYGYSVGFGFAFLGIAAITFAAADAADAPDLRALSLVLALVGALSLLAFAVSLFWLPRFLLPSWFRALKGLVGRSQR